MVEFVNGSFEEVKGNGFGKQKVWDMEGMRKWAYDLIEQAKQHNADKIILTQNDIEDFFKRFYKGETIPKTFSTITGKKGEVVWRLKHIIFKGDNRVKNVRATKRMTANGQEHIVVIELNGIAVNAPTTKTETPETPKKSLEEVMAENQKKIEETSLEEELDDIEIEIPSN